MAEKQQAPNVSAFYGLRTDTPSAKCPLDYSPDCADMIFSVGGMATRPPFRAAVTMPNELVYRKEFTCKNGSVQELAVDVTGAMYVIAADGNYTQIDQVAPGCSVNSVTAYGREYMAFFNADGGCDAPRQWDGKNVYRVSQGGPGAAPTFTAVPNTSDRYAIATIEQPAQKRNTGCFYEQSSGPGTQVAGTTVTIFYEGTVGTVDQDLVDAFNSGKPVYVYVYGSSSNSPSGQIDIGPITALVTSIGADYPPNEGVDFYYFTYTVDTPAYTLINPCFISYQRTLTTLTSAVPVPGLTISDSLVLTGTSIPGYNSTWPIIDTPGSGEVTITQSSLEGGVATYSYAIASGVAPVAGQQITITGLYNGPVDPTTGNSVLNVTNGVIATATGGEFTITGFAPGTYGASAESGYGTTAGTVFTFDTGIPVLDSSTTPVLGDATGGFVIFNADPTAIVIAEGNRDAVVFFITATGLTTGVSPIARFTVPSNVNAIQVDDLPIGPPNVLGRGVAFTGANGSKYFYLDVPAEVNGIVSGTATVVMDNVTTSATFAFADLSLFGGQAIDIPGNNLFEQVPLNLPRGVEWYQDRLFWIGEANVVDNFDNLGMDGGTLSGSSLPLGWTAGNDPGAIQQVGIMPAYMVTGPNTGKLTQPAATTPAGVAIIQQNLNYALRFWTAGAAQGSFEATLSSASTMFSSTATYDLSTVPHAGYYTMAFSATMPNVIPIDLTLAIEFVGLNGMAKVRDLQMIYADNPNRNPIARPSYVANPEAYDAETGNVGPNDDPTELRAIFRLQESLYFVTAVSLFAVEAIGNSEPSSWQPYRISDDCGAFNANAVATGKGWAAWAGPSGAMWFPGGLPDRTSATITPTWMKVANVTNVFNDATYERVYFGTINAAGNLGMLTYDYHEVPLGGPGKWCPWNRPSQWISDSAAGTIFTFGSKFYTLDTAPAVADDDLGAISGYYTFAAMLAGPFRKLFSYLFLRIAGVGVLTPFLYSRNLATLAGTLAGQELSTLVDSVAEWPVNQSGRMLFLKVGQPNVQFAIEDVTVLAGNDPNAPIAGLR
jgi:hypothetical protein